MDKPGYPAHSVTFKGRSDETLPGQLWQDKRDERRVVKVLSVSGLTVEYLRQYKARTTTGLTLIRSFRGDYKLIAEQEEQ